MHPDHRVELRLLHLQQALVAQDAGVVHEDVDGAEVIHRRLDDPLRLIELADVAVVRDGFTARGFDLLARLRGRVLAAPATVDVYAGVVDDDLSAVRRKLHRDPATDAAPRTGDDGDPTIQKTHVVSSFFRCATVATLRARVQ